MGREEYQDEESKAIEIEIRANQDFLCQGHTTGY